MRKYKYDFQLKSADIAEKWIKNNCSNYIKVITSKTIVLKCDFGRFVYSENGHKWGFPMLSMLSKLKKEIKENFEKKYNLKKEIRINKQLSPFYQMLNANIYSGVVENTVNDYLKILEPGSILINQYVAYDVKRCYATTYRNLGLISNDTYNYLICKFNKTNVNRLLGATGSTSYHFNCDNKGNEKMIKTKVDNNLKTAWIKVCRYVGDFMIKAARKQKDSFIMYYVDCFFTMGEENKKFINFAKENGYNVEKEKMGNLNIASKNQYIDVKINDDLKKEKKEYRFPVLSNKMLVV